ncbi:DinB family protein [Paenibacillus tarimensis]|uniref:DinB family protein n=1 Tax=Paenibacillus tarimensis TaxID=416012 RepID=UPI001F4438D2|nr:DinB family protein [Paenibacillus tarimensis]MCF2944647.1 DinB family protein [Paenibacillus tarimensis]
MLKRPGMDEYAPFYQTYIDKVPDGPIVEIVKLNSADAAELFNSFSEEDGEYRYAPGKWTIKELIGHIIDNERIMAYRLLRISRGDKTPLVGYDQDDYVLSSHFNDRPLAALAEEFTHVRRSTISLLEGLREHQWNCSGTANNYPVTVRALAYIMAGHELHHRQILSERYIKMN